MEIRNQYSAYFGRITIRQVLSVNLSELGCAKFALTSDPAIGSKYKFLRSDPGQISNDSTAESDQPLYYIYIIFSSHQKFFQRIEIRDNSNSSNDKIWQKQLGICLWRVTVTRVHVDGNVSRGRRRGGIRQQRQSGCEQSDSQRDRSEQGPERGHRRGTEGNGHSEIQVRVARSFLSNSTWKEVV